MPEPEVSCSDEANPDALAQQRAARGEQPGTPSPPRLGRIHGLGLDGGLELAWLPVTDQGSGVGHEVLPRHLDALAHRRWWVWLSRRTPLPGISVTSIRYSPTRSQADGEAPHLPGGKGPGRSCHGSAAPGW